MKKTPVPTRRARDEWRALVEACERSGLDRRAFAAREGLHERTFSWWASKLAPKRANDVTEKSAAFVPVRIQVGARMDPPAVENSSSTSTSGAVEIVLANGRLVRADLAQVDDPRFAKLLALAESAPC